MPHTPEQKKAYRANRMATDPEYAERQRARHRAQENRRNVRRRTAKPPVLCRYCSAPIPPQTGPGRPSTYCTPECRAADQSANLKYAVLHPVGEFECMHCLGTGKVTMPMCRICGRRLPKGKRLRALCSDECRAADSRSLKGMFRNFPRSTGTGGREGAAYKAVVQVVRQRALEGEGCYFCGGGFIWTLPSNHRAAFTAHHLDRLMDGNPAVPSPDRMVPAHRGCNSSDGLRAMNQKRKAQHGRPT